MGNGNRLARSPDGKLLVTAGGESKARLWDATTGLPVAAFDGLLARPQFGPRAGLLAGIGEGNSPRLWNLKTNKEVLLPAGPILGFAPDLSHAAYVNSDGTEAQFYDLSERKNKGKVTGKGLRCVGFSADGQLAALGGEQLVIVSEPGTGNVRARLSVPASSPIVAAALAADGKTLAYMTRSLEARGGQMVGRGARQRITAGPRHRCLGTLA